MATLNIKNFPDTLYAQLKKRAGEDHRSISQEVVYLLSEVIEVKKPRSILELQGLGKKHWKRIDSASHIKKERNSWD